MKNLLKIDILTKKTENGKVGGLIEINMGKSDVDDQFTWGHPYVANNIAQWISAKFCVKGVGYGQVIANCSVVSYYTSLIALSFYYMCASFSAILPW